MKPQKCSNISKLLNQYRQICKQSVHMQKAAEVNKNIIFTQFFCAVWKNKKISTQTLSKGLKSVTSGDSTR